MGQAFVERFLSQGFTVRLYNRTRDNIRALESPDVEICPSVEELINCSDTIIFMVSDADAINQILLHTLQSTGQMEIEGKCFLQMATISPQQSKEIETIIVSNGGHYLEAPVLGSIPEAKSGTLIIMAGGNKEIFNKALPVLQTLGQSPRHIGETGTAAALKLAMNQLIASLTAGFSLSLGYAIRNGVDTGLFMETVRESALYAKTYDKKLEKYLKHDFGVANFSTRHLLKDIRLFIADAKSAGLNTDALEGIERITAMAVQNGQAMMDYSSIYEEICPDN